jgi:hypothetical protein
MQEWWVNITGIYSMPELIVKKISGHSNNSRSFFRYVNFAQNTLDNEIDKMHRKIE